MANALQVDFFNSGLGTAYGLGWVYTYESGTTTDKTTYTEGDMSANAANPFQLDANGRATVYGNGNYTFLIKDVNLANSITLDNMYYAVPASSNLAVTSVSADYTTLSTDRLILVNTAAGNITITLLTAVGNTGLEYTIIKTSADSYTVTVDPYSTQTAGGASTKTLPGQYDSISIISDNANWQMTNDPAYVTLTGTETLTNKTLTSPVINTGVSGTAIVDEDTMASNSATKVPTQQSVKAYVDSGTVTMTNKTLTSPTITSPAITSPTITLFSYEPVYNVKPVVNATLNLLDIFTKSGGAVADATNIITIMIPDGTGYTKRTRNGAVASGTSRLTFADATNYWSRGVTSANVGDSSTQFDITHSGTTAIYTFDTTGTDPALSATWPRIGDIVVFNAQNFNAANNGCFVVTGSAANVIQVTNAAYVDESNKTIGTGSIVLLRPAPVYIYAIWSTADSGIVFATSGYSGFDKVPTTTTVTDDDYFLLEGSSTYTRANTDRCVVIAKIWKTYHTTDAPDHRLITAFEFAPKITWNPPSDYGYVKTLTTSTTAEADIAEASVISLIVKQSGRYTIHAKTYTYGEGTTNGSLLTIKTGSATYTTATLKSYDAMSDASAGALMGLQCFATSYLMIGDTIHIGIGVASSATTRTIYGDDTQTGLTSFYFERTD
jgi:hypothetical protein